MSPRWNEIAVGQVLCALSKGPISPAHIMRWSAAMENWHRIHYDQPFAKDHDKLPDILINGSWKQHVLVQVMKDGLGPDGWLWKLSFRYKSMDVVWDTLVAKAQVTEKREIDGLGFLKCELSLENQDGRVSTEGSATGVLPTECGQTVPDPFVPKESYRAFLSS